MNKLPNPFEYEDPIKFLRDSHGIVLRELHQFSKLLDQAESHGLPESFGKRQEWQELFHFFSVTVVQHEEDEEEALFPVLREHVPNLGFQRADAPIKFLTEGHVILQRRIVDLIAIWRKHQEGGALDQVGFIANGRELISLYHDHITTEEEAVYKTANEALSPYERIDIMGAIQRNHSKQRFMEPPRFEPPTTSGGYSVVITPERR